MLFVLAAVAQYELQPLKFIDANRVDLISQLAFFVFVIVASGQSCMIMCNSYLCFRVSRVEFKANLADAPTRDSFEFTTRLVAGFVAPRLPVGSRVLSRASL